MRRVVALLTLLALAPAAHAAAPPTGATWSETWIPTADGEKLHVDVMRPVGATDADKTPVILIVSPYLGAGDGNTEPGPHNRFYDLYEGAKVFERGYSVIQVATRGTGGSTGCLDILGPGEQTDIVTGVEFARSRPWSTGKVGMYGKSYDANLGTAAVALRPPGLEAVVAQQVVPDRFRGSYNDGVRLFQSLAYPAVSYGLLAEQDSLAPSKGTEYFANAAAHSADCQAHLAPHYLPDPASEFWTVRDFAERAKGSTVPTFLTAGYVDNATNIGGGVVDFFEALAGPKRLWIGWWDHVRGNDKAGNRLAMGREGFFDEVMRFYDEHLKDIAPEVADPDVLAQDSNGKWRTEPTWPPRDVTVLRPQLKAGSYADDGNNTGSATSGPGGGPLVLDETTGAGAWTFSPPLVAAAQVAGEPTALVKLGGTVVPQTNVVVNVYDVAPDGKATMITRGAGLASAAGDKPIELWPTDWTFAKGNRIGLLVSGANAEAYTHVPTNTTVTVEGGSVSLPFLPAPRVSNAAGLPAVRLGTYKTQAPFAVAAATIAERTDPAFPLPG
jgi:hypothetical protein